MAVDDRLGDVDDLVAVVLRVVAQHFERPLGADPVPSHQDSLGLLDDRAAPECALEAVVLGEALQRDVDRALQLVGGRVDDVCEDAALGCLTDRKSTRLNSSHPSISYAVFCLKKKI